jgi:hypothetical protein
VKLPDYAEQMIRELDEEDDKYVDDYDWSAPPGLWVERAPYQRRIALLFLGFREGLAYKTLRELGLLEYFAPHKRQWGGPRRKADSKPDPLDLHLDIDERGRGRLAKGDG